MLQTPQIYPGEVLAQSVGASFVIGQTMVVLFLVSSAVVAVGNLELLLLVPIATVVVIALAGGMVAANILLALTEVAIHFGNVSVPRVRYKNMGRHHRNPRNDVTGHMIVAANSF